MKRAMANASRATLAGLLAHYLWFYAAGGPLWTDTIAQWIMARTPSQYALWILGTLGAAAKPAAMTGGLVALGFGVLIAALARRWWAVTISAAVLAGLYGRIFEYSSIPGQLSFWIPSTAALIWLARPRPALPAQTGMTRREAFVMAAGTIAVAGESWLRDRSKSVATAMQIAPFEPPADSFGAGLVRKAVTPVAEFYGMSKNTVDPAPAPQNWHLRISVNGHIIRHVSYAELLATSRTSQYSTMRCISNTLKSDLMGTAQWTGVRFRQLVDPASLPAGIREVAVIGVDGHGDSLPPEFAFSDAAILAIGMNGRTLDRTHGFPVRLIVPKYYGFKNVKWIGEIAFVDKPYFGTWPRMGYTKDPVVHTGSHIDRIVRTGIELRLGGVAFAGDRGIRAVQVRADGGEWLDATLEPPLSPVCWRRWVATIPVRDAKQVQARAVDGTGIWQSDAETPLFPNGVDGPTIRSVS